ncbi:MAG TPA: hypothetical protein VGS07_26545 [Thermoanaerobaculia bacterium]|jgi:hypothetical protein|nr:hypothetical protein [Thermoanaerobaculia bacterium]
MLHPKVRRVLIVLALVLSLVGACPSLAAPVHRPQATQPPVAGLSLFDRALDWLGFPPTASLPRLQSLFEKTTGTTSGDSGTTAGTTQRPSPFRGVQIDPNG